MAYTTAKSSLRKAAVLIRSLDGDSAARLLARLTPQEAQALREAMREVDAVDETELSIIAAELQSPTPRATSLVQPKESAVVLELSEHATNVRQQVRETPPLHDSRVNSQLAELRQLAASAHSPTSHFHTLIEADARTLAGFLQREHSQTIAVVLSYLPAQKAAATLDALGGERQAEVIQRLSELGDTDSESLRVVEQNLEKWLATQRREQIRHADRMAIVRSILAATQDSTRQTILLRLQQRDRHLARRIEAQLAKKPSSANGDSARAVSRALPQTSNSVTDSTKRLLIPQTNNHQLRKLENDPARHLISPLCFDSLAEFSAIELTAVLRSIEPEIMHCALIGASDQLLDRVNKVLTRQQRKQLQRQLRSIGPTRLSDVETAQRVVTDSASRLMKQGLIEPPERHAA